MTERSGWLRQEISRRWPCRADRADAEALNVKLGLKGDLAFDSSFPPVWFVGNLDAANYVLVGVNPGRGTDGDPSWDFERQSLSGSFDRYWDSRLSYYRGPSYNWRHYGRTGTLVGALAQLSLLPREALESLCVQVELVPFFSKSQKLSDEQVENIRRDTEAGKIARNLLNSCLDSSPKAVIFRGVGGALDALLAENDGQLDTRFTGVGAVGWLRSSSMAPVRLIALSGAWSVQYESIRLLAAVSRGETVDWPERRLSAPGRQRSTQTPSLYEHARATLLGLSPDITIRPRTGGLRSEAFRVRRNFARLIQHRSWLEVHLLDAPGGFRTDIHVFEESQVTALRRAFARAYELGR